MKRIDKVREKRIKAKQLLLLKAMMLLVSVLSFSLLIMGIINDFNFEYHFFGDYIVVAAIMLFFIISTILYVGRNEKKLLFNKPVNNYVPLLMLLSIVFLSVLIDVIFTRFINMYSIPFLLPTILLLMLTDKFYANIGNILSASIYTVVFLFTLSHAYIEDIIFNMVLIVCYIIAGMLIIAKVDTTKPRIEQIVIATIIGLAIFAINMLAHAVYKGVYDGFLKTFWIIIGTVVSIGTYYLLLPVFEWLFKVCTDAKLMEYSNYNSPLLKLLKEKAPGTFNHSIVVSSIAEACAASIGENTLMARTAALYHDVGKTYSPEYFAENIIDGANPHDELIPEVSVSMIIKHAQKGYDLIKKYGMPEIIATVALEHHGDALVQYFYNKAQNISENKLDTTNYRYPNNRPSTKIAAIIMIVDTVEAATRANISTMDYEEISSYIKKLVKEKLIDGQFEYCDLTIGELNKITETIIDYMPGVYHKRVKYNNKNS